MQMVGREAGTWNRPASLPHRPGYFFEEDGVTKNKTQKKQPASRGKTARLMEYSTASNPLPGRMPSEAFLEALKAVGLLRNRKI
ncbi:MAG: hypothetical protein AB7H77_02570 [Bdellovibrionales bacterium]